MSEVKTLRIEDLSERVDIYEGETVRFTVNAANYSYRERYDDDIYSDSIRFKVGDQVAMWYGSSSRSISKYDIEGAPDTVFSFIEIDQNGQAVWQYSFIDDGVSEGAELIEFFGFSGTDGEYVEGFGRFDLVLNDPVVPEPEPTPDVVNNITNNIYNQTTNITNGDIIITNAYFSLDRIPVEIEDVIQGSRKKADFVGGTRKDDVIGFGKGRDRLMGDEGADQFVMFEKDRFSKKGADNIIDFSIAEGDQLIVSKSALKGLSKKAELGIAETKKEFKAMKLEPIDLIYYESKGRVYYDQNDDKKGFGKGGLFAILKGEPELDADSFGIMG